MLDPPLPSARGRVVDILYLLGGQLEVSRSTIMVAKTLTFVMFAAHQAIRPAFEAAKFMLRTKTTLAPSASARTVTRSPHSPSRRGISAPRRCCSHRSETSSHERGLRRSKPTHHRNAVAKSRAGPAKAVADLESIDPGQARGHGCRYPGKLFFLATPYGPGR